MTLLNFVFVVKAIVAGSPEASARTKKGWEHRQRIPEDIANKEYYHSTTHPGAGEAILASGEIRPPESVGKAYMSPVAGKVYVTPSKEYASIYALGGVMMGHKDDRVDETNKHGYTFVVHGSDFKDIQPDEDSIGELLHRGYRESDWKKQNEIAPVWLYDMATKHLSASTRSKIKDGEYMYFARAGKTLVKKMTDEQKFDLIRRGAHIAHTGALPVRGAYRIDRNRSIDVSKHGENLFDVAEKIKSLSTKSDHLTPEQRRAVSSAGGKARALKAGTKLPAGYVYHNTTSDAIEQIKQEGMTAGSFSDRPIKFGGDKWIAVHRDNLPEHQSHTYGNATAYEPKYEHGYDEDGFPIVQAIHPQHLYEVDSQRRIIRHLGSA